MRHDPIVLFISTDVHFSKAKEERQLYTLKPTTAAIETPPPTSNLPFAPASKPPPALRTAGPIRAQRESTQARMRTGPMTPALKARILRNMSGGTSNTYKTQTNPTQVDIPPIEAEFILPIEAELDVPDEPSQFTLSNDPWDAQELPPGSDFSEGYVSDSLSYTSTLSDIYDVDMDDSAPPATGPWMIVDHFTGEVIVDEEEVPVPTATTPGALFDSTIQVEVILGVTTLVQTPPPTLLFVDNDERPNWLIRSASEFLQHAPYYMCLNTIVDLFLAQEARLGYPDKVSQLCLSPLYLRSLTTAFTHCRSLFVSLYRPEIDPPKLPRL